MLYTQTRKCPPMTVAANGAMAVAELTSAVSSSYINTLRLDRLRKLQTLPLQQPPVLHHTGIGNK